MVGLRAYTALKVYNRLNRGKPPIITSRHGLGLRHIGQTRVVPRLAIGPNGLTVEPTRVAVSAYGWGSIATLV